MRREHLCRWRLINAGVGDPSCWGDELDAARAVGSERGSADMCPLGAENHPRGRVTGTVAQEREIEEMYCADVSTVRGR